VTYHEAKRWSIVNAVRSALGTPWVHQGRFAGRGLDCIGLALIAARAAGEITPAQEATIPNYGVIPHKNVFYHFMQDNLAYTPEEDALVGDLVLMCWRSWPMHVGVLVDGPQHTLVAPFDIVHAIVQTDFVAEHPFRPS
jgi:cell wall-associated NlpC family hydrolase